MFRDGTEDARTDFSRLQVRVSLHHHLESRLLEGATGGILRFRDPVAIQRANVPSAQIGVSTAIWMKGTPGGTSIDPNPRNRRMTPRSATTSATTYSARRAGGSFSVKAEKEAAPAPRQMRLRSRPTCSNLSSAYCRSSRV